QAEDGIRDFHVTGVQTCALPIFADLDLVLLGRIATLWQTRMLRYTRLTVADEIENALSYYRSTFLNVIPRVYSDLSRLLTREPRSEEHTSELQSRENLVCRLLLE